MKFPSFRPKRNAACKEVLHFDLELAPLVGGWLVLFDS